MLIAINLALRETRARREVKDFRMSIIRVVPLSDLLMRGMMKVSTYLKWKYY